MEWINYAVSILSGLAIAIPLVVKLIEYVKKAVKEKNWNKLLDLVMKLKQSLRPELKKRNGYLLWLKHPQTVSIMTLTPTPSAS